MAWSKDQSLGDKSGRSCSIGQFAGELCLARRTLSTAADPVTHAYDLSQHGGTCLNAAEHASVRDRCVTGKKP